MGGTAAVVVRYQHVIITAKDGRIAVAFVQIVFDIVEGFFVGFQQLTGYSLIVGEFQLFSCCDFSIAVDMISLK